MNSDLAKIITIVYIVITFLIPILYFLIYRLKPIKIDEEGNVIPKDYGKHFAISILIMVVFILVKIMVSLDVGVFNTANYYINYDFSSNETKEDIKQTTTKVTSTTTTTTTTTTKVTTTTKPIDGKHYERVSIIEGEQINKGQTTKGFDIVEVNGVTYIDGYLVANKTYFLPEDYVPVDTYKKADGNATKQCSNCINNLAYQAFKDMDADATAIGLNLWIQSGFRSFVTQTNIS